MTDQIFNLTVRILFIVMKIFNISYEKANVIIWYLLLPIIIFILNMNQITVTILYIYLFIYSCIKDLIGYNGIFKYSVKFLQHFSKYGISYNSASVIICLIIPAALLILSIL